MSQCGKVYGPECGSCNKIYRKCVFCQRIRHCIDLFGEVVCPDCAMRIFERVTISHSKHKTGEEIKTLSIFEIYNDVYLSFDPESGTWTGQSMKEPGAIAQADTKEEAYGQVLDILKEWEEK